MRAKEAALVLLGKKDSVTPEYWQDASRSNKPLSEKQIARNIYFELFRYTAWFYLLLPWLNLPKEFWKQIKMAWKECKESYDIYHAPRNMADLAYTVTKDRGRKVRTQYERGDFNYN